MLPIQNLGKSLERSIFVAWPRVSVSLQHGSSLRPQSIVIFPALVFAMEYPDHLVTSQQLPFLSSRPSFALPVGSGNQWISGRWEVLVGLIYASSTSEVAIDNAVSPADEKAHLRTRGLQFSMKTEDGLRTAYENKTLFLNW